MATAGADAMRRAYRLLGGVEAVVAGSFLVLMVGLIFSGGIARLAARPLNWTNDLATCLFAWSCFLCADLAWRKGGLMAIELATERLPAKAQRIVAYANLSIVGAFLLYVIVAGLHLSWVSRARTFQGIADVSYSWVTMSLPVGAALLFLTTIAKAVEVRRTPAGDAPDTA
jgi:TRAP-type C4-dicarboxylate transport system permease small subunit